MTYTPKTQWAFPIIYLPVEPPIFNRAALKPCHKQRNSSIAALRGAGQKYKDIARSLGLSVTRTQQICKEMNV